MCRLLPWLLMLWVHFAAAGPLPLPAMDYVLDPDGALSIEDVLAQDLDWQAVNAEQLPRYDQRHYWFRLQLSPDQVGAGELLLVYSHPRQDILNVYPVAEGRILERFETGSSRVFHTRPIDNPYFLFPVQLGANTQVAVYLQVQSRPLYLTDQLSLWRQGDYFSARHGIQAWHWFFLGLVAAIALYHLVVYCLVREPAYLIYSLYIVVSGLFFFSYYGYGFQYLWPDSPGLEALSTSILPLATIVLAGLFAIRFLGLWGRKPRWDWAILLIAGLSLGLVLVESLRDGAGNSVHLVFGAAAMFLTCWAASLYYWWRERDLSARNYAIAWASFLLLSLFMLADLRSAGRAGSYWLELALIIHVSLFAVVLASRINQLNEQRRVAEAQTQTKGAFLARMSHEIRTPMNGVLGMSQLLELGELSPRQRHYNQVIRRSGKVLLQIIDDILDYSRLDARQMRLDPVALDLRQWLRETLDMVRSLALDKGLRLYGLVADGLPTHLRADPKRLRQVLLNLLGNAIKFTPAGEVAVTVQRDSQGELLISVRDTGIGLPESPQVLFQAFQRGGGEAAHQSGTGLGLAIVQELVGLMGGEVQVHPPSCGGSEFRVHLPLPLIEAEPLPAWPELQGLRIVIVDSHPGSRAALLSQVASWGMDARGVAGVDEALAAIAATYPGDQRFDLLVTDDDLADGSAEQLLDQVWSRWPGTGIRALVLQNQPDSSRRETLQQRAQVQDRPMLLGDLGWLLTRTAGDVDTSPGTVRSTVPQLGLRVLVVEDNRVNQWVLSDMLQALGCHLTLAEDGRAALHRYRKSCLGGGRSAEFDLVLMDCEMPVMDGFAAAEAIRSFERQRGLAAVPILALTVLNSEEDRQRCVAAGMDDGLRKPLELEALALALQRFAATPSALVQQLG